MVEATPLSDLVAPDAPLPTPYPLEPSLDPDAGDARARADGAAPNEAAGGGARGLRCVVYGSSAQICSSFVRDGIHAEQVRTARRNDIRQCDAA